MDSWSGARTQKWSQSAAGQITSNVLSTVSVLATVGARFAANPYVMAGALFVGLISGFAATLIDCTAAFNSLDCGVGIAGMATAGVAWLVGGGVKIVANIWSRVLQRGRE